eukprot:c10659_g1_i1.p1 GENE.c10659_g1_i1~~c10659_g1_i1.p1  ORF type:complete len:216 (-),score=90.60 c10659_g1_i1:21-647(-)
MTFLKTLPPGFSKLISALEGLEIAQQRAFAESALLKLYDNQVVISTSNSGLSESSEKGLREALLFIYRCAEERKVSTEDFLEDIRIFTPLNDRSAQLLAKLWSQRAKYAKGAPIITNEQDSSDGEKRQDSSSLQIGEEKDYLVSMDWVLGFSIASSECSKLHVPQVSLQLNIAQGEGIVKSHRLELSMSEFQKFKQQIESVALALERS